MHVDGVLCNFPKQLMYVRKIGLINCYYWICFASAYSLWSIIGIQWARHGYKALDELKLLHHVDLILWVSSLHRIYTHSILAKLLWEFDTFTLHKAKIDVFQPNCVSIPRSTKVSSGIEKISMLNKVFYLDSRWFMLVVAGIVMV